MDVEIETGVLTSLRKLSASMQRRLVDRMESLGSDPRPVGCEKLSGVEAWRIRMGQYRIIYRINDRHQVVIVTRVGHRREVYRGL